MAANPGLQDCEEVVCCLMYFLQQLLLMDDRVAFLDEGVSLSPVPITNFVQDVGSLMGAVWPHVDFIGRRGGLSLCKES